MRTIAILVFPKCFSLVQILLPYSFQQISTSLRFLKNLIQLIL